MSEVSKSSWSYSQKNTLHMFSRAGVFLQHPKTALYLPYFSKLPYYKLYLPYFFLDRSQNQLQLPYIFADALFFSLIDMHTTILPMAIPVIYTLQLKFTHRFSIPFLMKC